MYVVLHHVASGSGGRWSCNVELIFDFCERSEQKNSERTEKRRKCPLHESTYYYGVVLNTYPRVKDRDLSTLCINKKYFSHLNSFFLRAFYWFNSLFFFALPILRLKEKCCCGFSRRLALQTSIALSKMRPHFKNIKKS